MTNDLFRVLSPGPYTTVQDRGRFGYQQYGVPVTGALDQYAFEVANMLVGNPDNAAVLETTFRGPRLEVMGDALVAVTGAFLPILLNKTAVEGWAAFRVRSGDVLEIGQARAGCRAYLAVSGGIDVPVVLGSRSCHVGARLGGHEGRILAKGDVLAAGGEGCFPEERRLPAQYIPIHSRHVLLRAVPGPQDDFFDEGIATFYGSEYVVTPHADRMGYRLQGRRVVFREGLGRKVISETSLTGNVQIPPDGQPIILLVGQTAGGYAKIATVISSDIPRVAQARPGDGIHFQPVDLDTAHRIYRERREALEKIREHLKV